MERDLEKCLEDFESSRVIMNEVSDCLKSDCLSDKIKNELKGYIKRLGLSIVVYGPRKRIKKIIEIRKVREKRDAERVMKFVRDHSENIEKFLKQGIEHSEKMEKFWEEEMADAKRFMDKEKK